MVRIIFNYPNKIKKEDRYQSEKGENALRIMYEKITLLTGSSLKKQKESKCTPI